MAARGARGALRRREVGGAPSGTGLASGGSIHGAPPRPRVGSARSTTPASPSASGAGSRSTRRISSPGSTSVPTASSTTPCPRRSGSGFSPTLGASRSATGAWRPGSSGVRGLRGEARAREKEHGSRRRRVERGRKDRGPAGGARGHGLPVYRGVYGERRRRAGRGPSSKPPPKGLPLVVVSASGSPDVRRRLFPHAAREDERRALEVHGRLVALRLGPDGPYVRG